MGDLRNKKKKLEEDARREDRIKRAREGWVVFHFDLKPQLTIRNLYLGEAIRYLMRVTGHRLSFWHCPVRGLAIQYKCLPTKTKAHDFGETYKILRFSRLENEAAAKRDLVTDMLLQGVELYRALPNAVFDEQVLILKDLLAAPPSVSATNWLHMKGKLHKSFQPLLETHQADLRAHLMERS